MALCVGPGGPNVLFGTYSHMQKVQNWGQGALGPVAPPGSATAHVRSVEHRNKTQNLEITSGYCMQ